LSVANLDWRWLAAKVALSSLTPTGTELMAISCYGRGAYRPREASPTPRWVGLSRWVGCFVA
jgi:hypothetical protein